MRRTIVLAFLFVGDRKHELKNFPWFAARAYWDQGIRILSEVQ
jgi:hypothetical protein